MLRDLLVQFPGFGTWPCDEINYIWRYGNRNHPNDEFTRDMATDPVARFVRGQFDKLARRKQLTTVVEKTCANSLRCEFVDEIFPESRLIHIVRDGRDVAVSASRRWNARLDIPYLLRKARFVPPSDLFYYARRYLANRVYRWTSGQKRLAFWGPRFLGFEDVVRNHPLLVTCALQWARCVESSILHLKGFPFHRVYQVRYEAFVRQPVEGLEAIAEFLGVDVSEGKIREMASAVTGQSVGRWQEELDQPQITSIERKVAPLLRQLGYHLSQFHENS